MKISLRPNNEGWTLLKFLANESALAANIAAVWRRTYPDDPDGWMIHSAVIHGTQEQRGETGQAVQPVGMFDDRELYLIELINSVETSHRAREGLIDSDTDFDGSKVKPIAIRPLKKHRGDWVKDQIIENLKDFWADSRAKRNALPTLRRMMDFQRTDGGLNRLGVGAARIAADRNISLRTAKQHIKTLLDGRLLILWQRGNNLKRKVSQYILNVDQFVIRPKSCPFTVNEAKPLTYLASVDWCGDPYGFQSRMNQRLAEVEE